MSRARTRQRPSNEAEVNAAFAVHAAALMHEQRHPELRRNPFWTIHRQDAYERFATLFEEHK